MLVDQFGRPLLQESRHTPPLDGGWMTVGDLSDPFSGGMSRNTLDRRTIREASRSAYLLNGLLYGAMDILLGMVLGDGVSYGEMHDAAAEEALEDFYALNHLDTLMSRWWIEYMVDGENLTVFPRDAKTTEPARIGFLDVDQSLIITTEPGNPSLVTSVKLGQLGTTYSEGEFVWSANESLWNDPRGWPGVARAVPPALAYVYFLNSRLRLHDLRGRVNAIYKAFTTTSDPVAELQAKAQRYSRMPKDGHVLTVQKNATSGESEEFELLTANTDAKDAESDARSLLRLFGLTLNLPEHYLGNGDTTNRATSQSMAEPVIKSIGRRQGAVRNYLNRLMQTELVRRFGAERLYLTKKVKVRDQGRTRTVTDRMVPATMLEFPWLFPSLRSEDMDGLVAKARLASDLGLASRQTLSGELGYDWALELENMSNERGNEKGGQDET